MLRRYEAVKRRQQKKDKLEAAESLCMFDESSSPGDSNTCTLELSETAEERDQDDTSQAPSILEYRGLQMDHKALQKDHKALQEEYRARVHELRADNYNPVPQGEEVFPVKPCSRKMINSLHFKLAFQAFVYL